MSPKRLTLGLGAAALASAVIAAASCSSSGGAGLGVASHDRYFKITGSHAGFTCDQCHDLTAQSFTAAGLPGDKPGENCLGCHADAQTTPAHAGVAGYAFANASCIPCHRDGTAAIDPAAHAKFFPIAQGTPHAGIGCVSCHGPNGKATAELQCAVCHSHDAPTMDGWHAPSPLTTGYAVVSGYANDGASCYRCHKDGSIPAFTHPFDVRAGSPHQGLACSDCHGATSPVLANIACTSCHAHSDQAATDAAHQGVSGYQYVSQTCATCHADGHGGLPAGHDTNDFPVTGTPHATLACADCHTPGQPRNDVTQITCVPCHDQASMASRHAAIPTTTTGGQPGGSGGTFTNYQWATGYCLTCHAEGAYQIASHPQVNGGITGEHHQPWCLACHQTKRTGTKPWGQDFSQSSCSACHTGTPTGG